MKSIISFIVLFTTLYMVQAKLDRDDWVATLKECKKKTGAIEDVEETFDKQIIPITKEGQCMVACALEEKKLMKDGKIDLPASATFIDLHLGDNEELKEKVASAIPYCIQKHDISKLNPCETAVVYLKCGQDLGIIL